MPARLAVAVQKIFQEDIYFPHISFYLVTSDDDLRRVAIGLNANRGSLTEVFDMLAFLPDEFQAAGLSLRVTPGTTLCKFANLRHHELEAADLHQVEDLC